MKNMKKYMVWVSIITLVFLWSLVYAAATINTLNQNVVAGDIITNAWYNAVNTMLKWWHTNWWTCSYTTAWGIMCNNFPSTTPYTTPLYVCSATWACDNGIETDWDRISIGCVWQVTNQNKCTNYGWHTGAWWKCDNACTLLH
jgi:hypothetical protein